MQTRELEVSDLATDVIFYSAIKNFAALATTSIQLGRDNKLKVVLESEIRVRRIHLQIPNLLCNILLVASLLPFSKRKVPLLPTHVCKRLKIRPFWTVLPAELSQPHF